MNPSPSFPSTLSDDVELLETLGSANPVEGRSRDVRLLDALRSVDANAGTACPADWRPGDEIILPPPKTAAEAERRVAENRDNPGAKDWFFVKRKP